MDESIMTLLHDCGFSKPVCRLTAQDKAVLRTTLLDYHCMIKVKACMDQYQYIEGFEETGILEVMKKHPEFMKSLFVDEGHTEISASTDFPCVHHAVQLFFITMKPG